MAAVVPLIDIAALPVSLLDRFAGGVREQFIALLRFLGPLTGGASASLGQPASAMEQLRNLSRLPQTTQTAR
jgi:hypothetical protein